MAMLNEATKKEIEELVEKKVIDAVPIADVTPEFLVHKTVEIYSNLLKTMGIF